MIVEIDAYFGFDSLPCHRPEPESPAEPADYLDTSDDVRFDVAENTSPDYTARATPSRDFLRDRQRFQRQQTTTSPPTRPASHSTSYQGPTYEMPTPPDLLIPDRPLGRDMNPDQKASALAELETFTVEWFKENWPADGWQNVAFGEGDPDADLMFVGEGPGADEDAQGRPFVGRAGKKLNEMITAMKLKREQVYIANIAKTRPPGNRVPTLDEATVCMPFLLRQIEIIQPKVIVCLGATATKYLLDNPKIAIGKTRGQWHQFADIPLMPTFHPAYLLRAYTVENRKRVWEDLRKVMDKLGLPS